MLKVLLDQIRSNNGALSALNEGLNALKGCNIFWYLRLAGRPQYSKKDSLEALATENAYASGWQDCLDLLENFEVLVLQSGVSSEMPRADFGSAKRLLDSGRITKEEYVRLKSGNLDD